MKATILFLLFASLAWSQDQVNALAHPLPRSSESKDKPVLNTETKLAIRNAQHSLDKIESQMSALTAEFAQKRLEAEELMMRLQTDHNAAKAKVDEAATAAQKAVDSTKWKFDLETLDYVEVPPQPKPTIIANPANAK